MLCMRENFSHYPAGKTNKRLRDSARSCMMHVDKSGRSMRVWPNMHAHRAIVVMLRLLLGDETGCVYASGGLALCILLALQAT